MKLQKTQIIAEAIALLNEEGLDNVSLRKLAQRLSVKAPSLAWHVNNKNNLLSLMSFSNFRTYTAKIPVCNNQEEWLFSFGTALWNMHKNVRDAARLTSVAAFSEALEAEFQVYISQVLAKVGLDTPEGYQMQSSIQALAVGWAIFITSPCGSFIEKTISIEESYFNSLAALIAGWGVTKNYIT